MEEYPQISVF